MYETEKPGGNGKEGKMDRTFKAGLYELFICVLRGNAVQCSQSQTRFFKITVAERIDIQFASMQLNITRVILEQTGRMQWFLF